ncbi:hypothetical protein TpMuguga_03g02070 [Theileria parva strain Muguga]|uniref:uncharacterized protein n=1 Tax=Theileria parva strain Muguga TaxID=333668 RepID=UPI001C617D08|nr:uncharacterized protein TpMuguga_03g02070 [Theileria parva strain Muguga]KAF5153551.1 hypothetical protein TpMuguga_03g02070 [Theileria parva strain Muguga]
MLEQVRPIVFDDNVLKADKERFVTVYHVEEPNPESPGPYPLASFLLLLPRLGTRFSTFKSDFFPNTEANLRVEDGEVMTEFVGFSDKKDWCVSVLTLWTPQKGLYKRFYFHFKDKGELKVVQLHSMDELVEHTRKYVKPEVVQVLKNKLPAHEFTQKLLEAYKHH